MKFKLGFLKKKHADGTIHSSASSVRPPPDEALKWAKSFDDLMTSKCKLILKLYFQKVEHKKSCTKKCHTILLFSVESIYVKFNH